MDDINEKLSRLLSSPEGMQKIQSAMAAFGGMPEQPEEAHPPPPPAPPSPPAGGMPMPDLGMLAKLAPLMGAVGKENDDTRLLQALRPYLHGEREHRLDDAVRLLQLTRLLPLLQTEGIFGGRPDGDPGAGRKG